MRSSDLALPTGWTPVRPAVWLAVDAVSFLMGLLIAVGGISLIGSGDWPLGGGCGLLGLFLISAVVVRRRRAAAHDSAPVDTVKGALRIGFSRAALIQGLALTAVGAVSAALFTVAFWERGNWVFLVACAALAVGLAVTLNVRYVRGITVGELRLSPRDVRLQVDARDVTVPWEDVIALTTGEMKSRYGIVTGRLLELYVSTTPRGGPPRPSSGGIRLPIHRIGLDEVVLHHLITYYLEHPRARDELAGPAAVARLRDRAFTR